MACGSMHRVYLAYVYTYRVIEHGFAGKHVGLHKKLYSVLANAAISLF